LCRAFHIGSFNVTKLWAISISQIGKGNGASKRCKLGPNSEELTPEPAHTTQHKSRPGTPKPNKESIHGQEQLPHTQVHYTGQGPPQIISMQGKGRRQQTWWCSGKHNFPGCHYSLLPAKPQPLEQPGPGGSVLSEVGSTHF
jgi:hypothetical protein